MQSGHNLTHVDLYTDGACSGNPGPGGWAAILVSAAKQKELSGSESPTTNQRMEIMAAVEGLRALQRPCAVTLFSDSAYLINCLKQRWYVKWRSNGWRNAAGAAVANRDLWEALLEQMERHRMTVEKVKGHAGHAFNERCDLLARAAVERQP